MSRLTQLKDKLKARKGVPGYEKNCEKIREEIKRLETYTVGKRKRTARKKEAP